MSLTLVCVKHSFYQFHFSLLESFSNEARLFLKGLKGSSERHFNFDAFVSFLTEADPSILDTPKHCESKGAFFSELADINLVMIPLPKKKISLA